LGLASPVLPEPLPLDPGPGWDGPRSITRKTLPGPVRGPREAPV